MICKIYIFYNLQIYRELSVYYISYSSNPKKVYKYVQKNEDEAVVLYTNVRNSIFFFDKKNEVGLIRSKKKYASTYKT